MKIKTDTIRKYNPTKQESLGWDPLQRSAKFYINDLNKRLFPCSPIPCSTSPIPCLPIPYSPIPCVPISCSPITYSSFPCSGAAVRYFQALRRTL